MGEEKDPWRTGVPPRSSNFCGDVWGRGGGLQGEERATASTKREKRPKFWKGQGGVRGNQLGLLGRRKVPSARRRLRWFEESSQRGILLEVPRDANAL